MTDESPSKKAKTNGAATEDYVPKNIFLTGGAGTSHSVLYVIRQYNMIGIGTCLSSLIVLAKNFRVISFTQC